MNYNYLLYFSVLAQTEHYTTAAARLGISQPALSSAIHNLENALGGVKKAVEEGKIHKTRYDNYVLFYEELKEKEKRKY